MGTNARFAPVAPAPILKALKDLGRHVIGNYHLLLAHDVVENPEGYQEVFHDMWNDPDLFIIMDNSAVELGAPCSPEMMKKAVEIIENADGNWGGKGRVVCVLPDYIGNAPMTVSSIKRAVHEWSDHGLGNFMILPQGDNGDHFKWAIEQLSEIDHPEAKYWGIPRHATKVIGSRLPVSNYAHIRRADWPQHMFGFSHNMIDDMQMTNHNNVMGIDSAVPIRLGLLRIPLKLVSHYDTPPRGNYWEATCLNKQAVRNLKAVRTWTRSII